MILCDTNILIEFYKGNAQVLEKLRVIGTDQIAISVVTQAELYFGALNKGELQELKKHLEHIHIYSIDDASSVQFIQLMEAYSLSHKLSIPDILLGKKSGESAESFGHWLAKRESC